jgi:hypothetical protein
VAPDFQVNTYTTGDQFGPSVASAPDGAFVVVWTTRGAGGSPDGSYGSVRGRSYDSSGSPQGVDFQVNTYTTGEQSEPSVAVDGLGDFVVVWTSREPVFYCGASGPDGSCGSIQAQRYDSSGGPRGSEFQVNSYTTGDQFAPSVAAQRDGGFVIVWSSLGSFGTDSGYYLSIQGQRYDSLGDEIDGEFQVNTYTPGDQRAPSVSVAPDGGFVVVWESAGSSGNDSQGLSVQGRRYDPAGAPLGDEVQLNTHVTGSQSNPSVAATPEGGFMAVWESSASLGGDQSLGSVQGRRFDSGGGVGDEFQVNVITTNEQAAPSVSVDADGGFVVAWHSGRSAGTDGDYSIQARLYDSAGNTVAGEFQVNDYTPSFQNSPSVARVDDGGFVVVWESYGSAASDTSLVSIQGRRFAVPEPSLAPSRVVAIAAVALLAGRCRVASDSPTTAPRRSGRRAP